MERFRLLHGGQAGHRTAERRPVQVSGQIVWKDARGTTRLSRVVTRDVSESGVAVDCINGSPIPLYRLVYFQVDRSERNNIALPEALRRNAVLAAVFRVGETNGATGAPGGYALRLLLEPQAIATARPYRLEAIAQVPAAV
ncbi:MAG: hypothetical protein ACM36C_00530 [Acidobacteriota bacterium]